MVTREFDDETLKAYAAGDLDEATSRMVERAMTTDDALAHRVGQMLERRTTSDDVGNGGDAVGALEAVAQRLGANSRKRKKIDVPVPIVAIVFGALTAVIGYSVGVAGYTDGAQLRVANLSVPGLPALLDATPSGDDVEMGVTGARFRAASTFFLPDGTLCREFDVQSEDNSRLVSVACRQDGKWRVDFAAVAQGRHGSTDAPSRASLEAYLRDASAGEPVSQLDEAELLAGGLEPVN